MSVKPALLLVTTTAQLTKQLTDETKEMHVLLAFKALSPISVMVHYFSWIKKGKASTWLVSVSALQ